jgi:putative membrane protein
VSGHFAASLSLLALLSAAQAADSVSKADGAFIAMVSQGGLFEMKAGFLAADKGNTQDIKDLGYTEFHDHRLVNDKLKSIAAAAGVDIASELNPQLQKELDRLSGMSGYAFDAAFLTDMEGIHAKDGAAFADEATDGTNPRLRAFAAETHRIVLRHIGALTPVGAQTN